ncbi:hypothetical protein Fmac_000319 [Flemingia macrophylla]|uniref:Uncharacterized protein n=1 Tax=Flemingia macrophylla TaxID=520843 RepID=A0ABD1NDY6_9FABA
MPSKKQQCGFRIPWISGPSTETHSPPPKQKSKSFTHRPPFRPPGIASTPRQPPPQGTPKTEPQQVSTSLASHSPAPSVIIDFPESSLSESPSTPSVPNVKESTSTENSNSNSNSSLATQSKPHQPKSNNNNIKRVPSVPRPKKSELDETPDKKQTMMFARSNPSGKDIKLATPASTSATISLSNEENEDPTKDDNISDLNPTLAVDDKTLSVVTLAGDNRGVTMHVSGSHSTRPKPEQTNTSTEKDEAAKTYVNSNVQSINNSIMSHGSINGRDPGVRVILPPQPQPEVKQPMAEVSINRAERVPSRPVVRRRCLRGLMLEPSDSEPDKPRRHGCKFRCGDNNTDVKDIVTK